MVSADMADLDTVHFQALLLDSVGQAVIATDVAGIVIYWNGAAELLYGWTAQEAVGQPIVELTPAPQSVEEASMIFAELAAGRSWTGEFMARARDGRAFMAHVTDTPVIGADGSLQAVIGISTDITERKRAEQAVRHLSAIVESSNDAIIGKTLDGTILSWNGGAERLYGYAAAEVTGQSIRILAPHQAADQEITDLMRRVALGDRVEGLETARRHKDGSVVDISLAVSPVYDPDGSLSGFSTIARDDSARKEVERALKHQADLLVSRLAKEAKASERLRELDQIKDDLVATVSHELRTPLTSILGYVELLKDQEAGPLTAQQRKWADAMDRSGDRLLALVDNLLTASAIDAGRLQSDVSPVDLRDVITAARRALQPGIDGRRLTTRFHVPATPVIVQGDAGQLEQVVCDLVGNALKFTEDGGTVECGVDSEGSRATITVSDDGIGIPENEQRGLFTRFFRATAATDLAIPGTGLGLSIASSIVESHQGGIALDSAPGRGTRVVVDLPMTGRPAAETTETVSRPGEATKTGDDTVAYLREAGDHPLMYAFPQGAVFAFDQDLRYLSAGGLGLADVGLSREMLEGKTIFDVFPAETAAAVEPLYRAALGGTSTTWDVPFEDRVYAQHLAPVTDAAGRIVAGLGFTQDVTEARAAEHTLRESEERNRLTFEHAPIGKAIVELDGTWRHVNAAVTQLTGYTEEQLLGMTFQDVTHPDDLELDLGHLSRLIDGEIGSYEIEKRYLTASGQNVWVLLSVALVRDQEGSPLYLIAQIQDIDAAKRQHQALQDLTAMLAHDLRTPAAVILGFAELLEAPATDPELVRSYAARISAGARAMTDLLENALTATALDSGQLVASPKGVALRDAVATAIQTSTLGSMSVGTTAVEDVAAWVDPVHLHQVLSNLLTNAAKYGGDEVVISASPGQGRTRITIADNGPGVEPDFVTHLFGRFSRSTAAREGRQRGTGLGLYIVRDLLAANGGTIDYSDSQSGGAEFTLELDTAGHSPG